MALPTLQAAGTRVSPASATQIDLKDGYRTVILLDPSNPNLMLWERVVPPPGLEGGDPIDTTTMHNATYRTFHPRALITLTPITVVGGYDPQVYSEFISLINVVKEINIEFPDLSVMAFWGYTQSFTPQDHVEGDYPTANVVVVPTNWDNVNKVEAGPAYTDVTGT